MMCIGGNESLVAEDSRPAAVTAAASSATATLQRASMAMQGPAITACTQIDMQCLQHIKTHSRMPATRDFLCNRQIVACLRTPYIIASRYLMPG